MTAISSLLHICEATGKGIVDCANKMDAAGAAKEADRCIILAHNSKLAWRGMHNASAGHCRSTSTTFELAMEIEVIGVSHNFGDPFFVGLDCLVDILHQDRRL